MKATLGLRAVKRAAKDALVALAFARTDAFIASYPKSGRTWLRFILANYLNRTRHLGLDIDLKSIFWIIPNDVLDPERGRQAYRFGGRSDVPLLVASHTPYRGVLFRNKPILFMLREPKDVLVSYYFHRTKQARDYRGTIADFLRDPEDGVADYIHYINLWAEGLNAHRHLLFSYEQLSHDPPRVLEEVLRFLGLGTDPDVLMSSITASRFETMQAIEREGGVAGHVYDREDLQSRRVRKGKIGGFREQLGAGDADFVDRACRDDLSEAAKQLFSRVGICLS